MLLLLTPIDQFPQFDLDPIHHFIILLYLPQRLFLICLNEHVNQLLDQFILPLVLFIFIASEIFEVFFYFVAKIDAILFH